MNEAIAQVEERDSEADMPTVMSDLPDEKLTSARLPPMTPPPMRPPSVPPAAEASPLYAQEAAPSYPPATSSYAPVSGTYRGDTSGPPQPRTSWWKALLTATYPPPASAPAPTDERVIRRRIGATCAGMAIGFVILALALGLRGAEPAFSPMVAAAMVLGRAVIAVGFLAFGYGLLRMAERFFTTRSSDAPPSSTNLH
jgi:hypothetical protein